MNIPRFALRRAQHCLQAYLIESADLRQKIRSFCRQRCNIRTLTTLGLLFTLWISFAPFTRAFFRAEISYNEGWNVYNAERVVAHQQLYPTAVGWTTVNYPMLSFWSEAALHSLTHEYIFSARILSLASMILCCALVGLIVDHLGRNRYAAVIAGAFCMALFVVAGDSTGYVGADDPQIYAQVFYLAGFYVYLVANRSNKALLAVAALFVLGGSIKHNLLEFPLAVMLDLLLTSRRRAALYAAFGAALAATSVAVQQHMGGPAFVADLLAPRAYSLAKVGELLAVDLAPLMLPLVLAALLAGKFARATTLRPLALLFGLALLIGGYFSGGDGVSVNTFFGVFLALAILLGVGLAHLAAARPRAMLLPAAVWCWLLIPWLIVPPLDAGRKVYAVWDPALYLHQMEERQERFAHTVSLLESQPGPALCESLLACATADKPYLYDPYNATRFINLGRLQADPLLEAIREHRFSAIQLNGPLKDEDRRAHFSPAVIAAIQAEYLPLMSHEDGQILIPAHHGPANVNASISDLENLLN